MNEQQLLEEIRLHQGMLHKVCRLYCDAPEDREDLFQEIVYQVWRSLPSFKGQSKFSSWMYRIALNTAMAGFRRRGPELSFPESLPEPAAEQADDALAIQQEQLFAALRRLNDAEKALVALYLEDLSYTEIAAVTGIDENNVGVKLHRIRAKIKHLLKQV